MWQLQGFGCLGFFLGGRSTSCEKILRILNCIGTATYVASDVGFLSLVEARCYFDTAHATFSSFCVCVCWLDRSPCGAVFILILLVQPSRHFVRVRSLSLWRRAYFHIVRATVSSLCACWLAFVAARCSL